MFAVIQGRSRKLSLRYKCPHCGKEIKEVEVVEMTWRKTGIAAGLGIGCGLLIYPLVSTDAIVSAVGAFVVGFIIVFLVMREKR